MSKSSFHLRDALNASEQQLTQWLTKLPDPSAKAWSHTPFPLFRALQLDNKDLFYKWLEWGCRLSAPNPFRNPLARRVDVEEQTITTLFKKFPEVLEYVAKYDPMAFEASLDTLVQEYPQGLNNVGLPKLIHQSGVDLTALSDMAMASLVYGGFSPNDLLKSTNGRLEPISQWVSSYTNTPEWAWGDEVRGVVQEEYKICERINQLPSGLLTAVDVSALVDMGMIVAAHDLKQHLIFNDIHDGLTVDRKKIFSWSRVAKTLSFSLPRSQNYYGVQRAFHFSDAQWKDLFDCVFEDILDIRAVDKNKQNVFHFLHLCTLPAEVKIHIARKAWEAKPSLLTMVDRKLKKSFMELTQNIMSELRQAVDGWESTAKINNILEHQTTKDTQQKIAEEPEEPVRRRRM